MSIKPLYAALSALAFVIVSASSALASNNPIPGIDVVVQKKPCCSPSTMKTDAEGKITLKLPEAGNYEVALLGATTKGAVSMTTFVNGKVAARTVFPVGSSVGTFAVANPKDTIILKFESNSQPVNDIGGQGGGRYTFKPTGK